MSIINYHNPTVINWNLDDNGKPISLLIQNETKQVVDGKIPLEGLPDEQYRVQITGYVEINIKDKIDAPNKFKCDYTHGILYFDQSKNGTSININRYYSRGQFYMASSRIWTKLDDFGNVIETMADALDGIAVVVDTVNNLDNSIDTANTLKSDLDNSHSTLNETIVIANNTNTVLNGSVVLGKNKIQEMDSKIVEASNKIAQTEDARLSVIDTENRFEVFEAYNPLTNYEPLNKVTFNGDIYVCKIACTDVSPVSDTFWLKIMGEVTRVQDSTINGNIILDGVETVVYTHSPTHGADMIVTTTEKQFISQTEKDTYSGKQNNLGFTPENIAKKGVANGYTPLDSNGLIPAIHFPDSIKSMKVVANISERDLLSTFEGMKVHVLDASADETVDIGWAEYMWVDAQWIKKSEKESLDVITDWSNVANKPISTVVEIDQTVTDSHIHDNKGTLDLITEPFTTELKQKIDEVGTAIVSEIEPTENLKNGVMWYKSSLKETKVYLDGEFRSVGGSDTVTMTLRNTIEIETNTTAIPIGIPEFDGTKDVLFVYQNSIHLQKDVDYTISEDGKNLVRVVDTWYSGQVIDIVAIISTIGNPDIFYSEAYESEYIATTDGESVGLLINQPLYNPDHDIVKVYHENLRLFEGDNYILNREAKTIDLVGFTINTGDKIKFEVVKKMRSVGSQIDGIFLKEGSVSKDKLSSDVFDEVNANYNSLYEDKEAIKEELSNHKGDYGVLKDKIDNATYSTNVVKQEPIFSVPSNAIKGQVPINAKGLSAVNLIKNGDFRDGLDGWTPHASGISLENGRLKVTPNGQWTSVSCAIPNTVINHKYYFMAGIINGSNDAIYGGINLFETVIQSNTSMISSVREVTSISTSITFGDNRVSGWGAFYIEDVILIDLTSMFGVGNEPNQEQCDKMFANYFDGIGCVNDVRIKSRGKNLFDGILESSTPTRLTKVVEDGRNCYKIEHEVTNLYTTNKFKPLTQYTLKSLYKRLSGALGSAFVNFRYTDGTNDGYVNQLSASVWTGMQITSAVGKTVDGIFVTYANTGYTVIDIDTFQLEEGIIATTYEPYVESISPLPKMNSLPNGVKDEVVDGKFIKRTAEMILDGSESWTFHMPLTNTIQVYISKPIGWASKVSDDVTSFINNNLPQKLVYGVDEEGAFIGNFYFIRISRSKLVTQDLAGVKAWLQANPMTLIYELAQPIVQDLVTPLTVYPKGTISIESDKETTIPQLTLQFPMNMASVIEELNNGVNQLSKVKVDKVQEDWINATLINGWTGTLQYKKNALNQVTIKFELIAGSTTTNTVVASLPVGYQTSMLVAVSILNLSVGNGGVGLYLSDGLKVAGTAFSTGDTVVGKIIYEAS